MQFHMHSRTKAKQKQRQKIQRGGGLISTMLWIAVMIIVAGAINTSLKTEINHANDRAHTFLTTTE